MTFTIKHRHNGSVLFTSETAANRRGATLEAVAQKINLTGAVLTGADLRSADLRGADLRSADLTGADLTGAVLTGAVLRGAVLTGAVLTGADLTGADLRSADLTGADRLTIEQITGKPTPVPKIDNIHQKLLIAVTTEGCKLDMSNWHDNTCKTSHCRAGWVVTLAGTEGEVLEDKIGTPAAAMRIYLKSDPGMDKLPEWFADNESAMADIVRCAQLEAKFGTASEGSKP